MEGNNTKRPSLNMMALVISHWVGVNTAEKCLICWKHISSEELLEKQEQKLGRLMKKRLETQRKKIEKQVFSN